MVEETFFFPTNHCTCFPFAHQTQPEMDYTQEETEARVRQFMESCGFKAAIGTVGGAVSSPEKILSLP